MTCSLLRLGQCCNMQEAVSMDPEAAPLCGVCNHHHEQGVKCTVCGHTGKSRVYQLLRNRPLLNVFSVRGYDCLQRNPSVLNLDRGLYAYTKILRGRIFPSHLQELTSDASARHIIAFIGDAPIATARWRVVSENGEHVVEIDLLGVLEGKRQKGYGKQLMEHILEDINTRLLELNVACRALLAHIPENDHAVPSLKLFESVGFHLDAQRHIRDGVSWFRMILLAPS